MTSELAQNLDGHRPAFKPRFPNFPLSPHPVISGDASVTRYSPSICLGSIESSSLSNPAEHVGSHSGTGFGCLAELGSEGIAAGAAPSLDFVESLLQPLQSIASPSSISPSHFQLPFCFIPHLIHRLLAALFFRSGLGIGTAITLRHFQPVISQFTARALGIGLGTADAQLLAADS